MKNINSYNPWLNRFAAFAAINTLALIALGGLVTSKGVGMAVPDWPTTYGYNMFFFPISMWTGGIFYEHTHRLFASWVGLLTVTLAVWMAFQEPRSWVRRLGYLAVFLVIFQGILGGLRVRLSLDQIGIVHAALAQSFLVLVSVLFLVTTRWWHSVAASRTGASIGIPISARNAFVFGVALIFAQLLLGASMRHQHAGLAIPDFPLAYGKLWPATDAETMFRINQSHADVTITPFQIYLHMAHRIGALVVFCASLLITRHVLRAVAGANRGLAKATLLWQGVIVLQAALGAATVWTGKAADIATLHVVIGASCLVGCALLAVAVERVRILALQASTIPVPSKNSQPRVTSPSEDVSAVAPSTSWSSSR